MASVLEPAQELSVAGVYDVVVCGGGPAGVAAALRAARAGAHTALLETHGCLGGVWTAGMLSWILDYENKTGIMTEILDQLQARGARTQDHLGNFDNAYDAEKMKHLLEELCVEAGVEPHLHTRVVGAMTNHDNRLTHVIIESRSGREVIDGTVFIDCTGDGDLAARAGCDFDMGRPGSGEVQPLSLMALLTGIRAAEVRDFYRVPDVPGPETKKKLLAEFERAGVQPSYSKPTLFRLRDDFFALMANHEYGVRADDARGVTAATIRARAELNRLVAALRRLGAPWSQLQLVATGAQIGVREGRRIHGLYTVSEDDLRRGIRHEDAVCRVTFPIDVHATDPAKSKAIEREPFRAQPYDIPLRALIARDVDGLLLAGRCISGDFIAHSSYRVTGNAVALGEAAGHAAALAVARGQSPQDLTWAAFQSSWRPPMSPNRSR